MDSTKGTSDIIELHSTQHHAHTDHVQHSQLQAAHLFQEDEHGNVIGRLLIPRPTNDPKDPLTWSPIRKHAAFAAISSFVFLSNFSLTAIAPGLPGIIEEFGISATQSSYLVSGQVLLLGLGNLFWIPLSLKVGKRPVCVLSSCIFFVGCIWSAVAKSYGSLLASRIVTGFGGSCSEAMGPTMVADLYFLHERATKTGFYTFMIGGGCAIGGTFAGLVVNAKSDWRWIFWMCSILHGTSFTLIALFSQETNFIRPVIPEDGSEATNPEVVQSKYNFVRAVNLFSWYDHDTSMLLYFWRPIQLLAYPAVFWAAVTYGVTLGCAFFQMTANGIYFPTLYNFSPLGVGNLGIAYFIASILGCIYGGPLCDWTIAVVTKRRGGYFKPEYRLYLMIGPLILGPVGLIMWGAGLQNHLHWAVPVIGSGITYGVLCAVPTIVMTYVVDSYTPVAGEVLTGLTAFKNTFAFGIALGVVPWIEKNGFVQASGYQTLIESFLILLAIPLYIYGEKLRRWSSRFDI